LISSANSHAFYSLSIGNDVKIKQVSVNATLFPNVDDNVQVHEGFAWTQGRTADTVLSAVKDGLKSKGVSKVMVTGHSLGMSGFTFILDLSEFYRVRTIRSGYCNDGRSHAQESARPIR
jgi:predicted lipase